jgi:hypothetical protein
LCEILGGQMTSNNNNNNGNNNNSNESSTGGGISGGVGINSRQLNASYSEDSVTETAMSKRNSDGK